MEASTCLNVASKISNDYRVHDRLVKVLQYSCTVLAWHGVKQAKDTRYTLSTARKAFYLFRSVCHLQNVMIAAAKNGNIVDLLPRMKAYADMLEQVSLVIYYILENIIYLARCSLISYHENTFSATSDLAWFAGDAFGLVSSIIDFRNWCLEDKRKHGMSSLARVRITGLVISMLDVAVAGHYIGLWKAIFGEKYNPMNEWRAGVGGALSSSMVLINKCFELAEKYHSETQARINTFSDTESSDSEEKEEKIRV